MKLLSRVRIKRIIACMFIVVLSIIGLATYNRRVSADCNSNMTFASRICRKLPGPDGKIHVTYSFHNVNGDETTPSTGYLQAVENAVAQWNGFSDSTNIVIERASPGQLGDIDFRTGSAIDVGPCAGLLPSSDYIVVTDKLPGDVGSCFRLGSDGFCSRNRTLSWFSPQRYFTDEPYPRFHNERAAQ